MFGILSCAKYQLSTCEAIAKFASNIDVIFVVIADSECRHILVMCVRKRLGIEHRNGLGGRYIVYII